PGQAVRCGRPARAREGWPARRGLITPGSAFGGFIGQVTDSASSSATGWLLGCAVGPFRMYGQQRRISGQKADAAGASHTPAHLVCGLSLDNCRICQLMAQGVLLAFV